MSERFYSIFFATTILLFISYTSIQMDCTRMNHQKSKWENGNFRTCMNTYTNAFVLARDVEHVGISTILANFRVPSSAMSFAHVLYPASNDSHTQSRFRSHLDFIWYKSNGIYLWSNGGSSAVAFATCPLFKLNIYIFLLFLQQTLSKCEERKRECLFVYIFPLHTSLCHIFFI